MLVDHVMPMKEDLLDAIMKKKPFVVGTWVEVGVVELFIYYY